MSKLEGKTPEEMTMEELEAAMLGQAAPSVEPEAPKNSEQNAEASEQEEKVGQPEQMEEIPEASEQAQEEVAEQQDHIPEKYRGKSAEDLLKILQDQERYIGKLGNERSTTKREMDELREEFNKIKSSSAPQNPANEEVLRQGLEEDPAKALINYIDGQVGSLKQEQQKRMQQERIQEMESYYNQKVASDPDFLRRTDKMSVVADALKPYVKEDFLQSKGFLEIVDLVSQAADRDYYVEAALRSERSKKDTALEEKRKSKTESSYSQGAASVPTNPAEMTDEELEQALRMLGNK